MEDPAKFGGVGKVPLNLRHLLFGLEGAAIEGLAERCLPPTRLEMFAIPIKATITMSAVTMGLLFFSGPAAYLAMGVANIWLIDPLRHVA